MSEYQSKILNYLEENIVLKGKEVFLEYDDKSVVIIDESKILHFIYKDNKIYLVDSIVSLNYIKNKYRKAV